MLGAKISGGLPVISAVKSYPSYPYWCFFPPVTAGIQLFDVLIGPCGLSDDTFAQQDRLGQSGCHHLVAVDQWQQETQVLLRAAQVVAERRAPLVPVRLQGVL